MAAEPITLTSEQVVRIRQSLGEMPYLPLSDFYKTRIETGDDLVRTLESFVDALVRVAGRQEANDQELRELRGLVGGVGAFLARAKELA